MRMLFDAAERSQEIASCVEDRGRIALARERFFPRSQNRVFRFHRLQETACADTFRAPF